MQPIVTKTSVGLSICVTGNLHSETETVHLRLEYNYTEVKNVEEFTFDTAGGPFTIDVPRISATGFKTSLAVPIGKMVAVTGGQISRIVTKETSVTVLGKIPYVRNLFKNVSAAQVDVTPVILISADLIDASELPADANVKSEAPADPEKRVLPVAQRQ